MKNRVIAWVLIVITVATLGLSVVMAIIGNYTNMVDHIQDLDYSESGYNILNPHQGFYRTARMKVTEDYVEDKSHVIEDNYQMYHLRMDISDYSSAVNGVEDKSISNTTLDRIDAILNKFLEADKNVIIRFAYDPEFNGNSDMEPSVEMILNHITSICSVLNKYPHTITAIETGLIGPWGEMHTSTKANATIINQIIDKYLDETSTSNIPILVRTPQMMYDYLGITIENISSHSIPKNNKAYRLGLFNDGYLGSDSDLGTYTNRLLETIWLSQQNEHLPYGGEVTTPSSTLHDIDKCIPEMYLLHLSYLNYEWNDEVTQGKWQEQLYTSSIGSDTMYHGKTAYEYIRDHLGYRYVLSKSTLSYSKKQDKLNINLKINSKGFGYLNHEKDIYLILKKDDGTINTIYLDKYRGQKNLTLKDISIVDYSGNYEVYIKICNTIGDSTHYPIRLANNLWDSTLKANKIGSISIK